MTDLEKARGLAYSIVKMSILAQDQFGEDRAFEILTANTIRDLCDEVERLHSELSHMAKQRCENAKDPGCRQECECDELWGLRKEFCAPCYAHWILTTLE